MLLHLPQLLSTEALAGIQQQLADAPWADGRATAGAQAAQAKHNQQLPERWPGLPALQRQVLDALARHPLFFSAALPQRIAPPMFNRYAGAANAFGNHVDSAVRHLPDGGLVRSDISCTLFLADPASYDGGELVVEDTYGAHRVKLPAGDLVLYPAHSVHRVEPVTRGQRLASFFWVQSMVRSDQQRRLLFDMDQHLMRLRSQHGEADPAIVGLTGTYHNLLRMWIAC